MRHMYALTLATAAILISGCAGTKPLTPIEQTIPMRAGETSVTIIAPQDMYLPAAGVHSLVNYDYFVDCPEDHCRVGKMHALQYITISPSIGSHTLYVKQADDGIIDTLNVFDINTTAMLTFDVAAQTRQYISHEWKFSFASLAGPLSSAPSKLIEIDDKPGHEKVQKVLDTTSIFGTKMNGYGERGITY
jgi:hypothetical protein